MLSLPVLGLTCACLLFSGKTFILFALRLPLLKVKSLLVSLTATTSAANHAYHLVLPSLQLCLSGSDWTVATVHARQQKGDVVLQIGDCSGTSLHTAYPGDPDCWSSWLSQRRFRGVHSLQQQQTVY